MVGGGPKFETVFFCRDDFETFWTSIRLNIISGEGAREDRIEKYHSGRKWEHFVLENIGKSNVFRTNTVNSLLIITIGNTRSCWKMHLICSEIDIFDCGLLWRPLLILYSKDFKSKMFQIHLCKKKHKRLSICCTAELYWGGSSYGHRVAPWTRIQHNIMLDNSQDGQGHF